MDQVDGFANERFKRIEVFAVPSSGSVLTYIVESLSEIFGPPLICGYGYNPALNPNDCINKSNYIDDGSGNIHISVWKE